MDRPDSLTNFGGNLRLAPRAACAPRTETELLEILNRHRSRRIRAIGRLHSWSAAADADDVLVDMRRFDSVNLDAGAASVQVGAGCQIKRAIAVLDRRGLTLPSLGLIDAQAIAGAAATGTHGSGRNSLSHYVQSLRIAHYDESGQATISTVGAGDELKAARCSLGCLGIVTSVQMPVRRQYFVEEHFRRHAHLDAVLAAEAEFDLQQFFFLPWRWDFFAQHRREVDRPRSALAPLYRLYWQLGMDVGFHLAVRMMANSLPAAATKTFYRFALPRLVPQRWRVVDVSHRQLTMHHDLFRHIEIEVFVRRSQLAPTLRFVERLLRHFGGEAVTFEPGMQDALSRETPLGRFERLRGSYAHHYPICIRKVLADDTLISMSANAAEPSYALSFISYVAASQRQSFFDFAHALARAAAILFDARPHWGKVFPLDGADVASLYPRLSDFVEISRRFDPHGAFRNLWVDRVLFPEESQ